MCLVISLVFLGLAYMFFEDGNMQAFSINLSIALFFIFLLTKNILKTKKDKKN